MARLSDKFSQHAQKIGGAGASGPQIAAERDILAELPLSQIEPDPDQPRQDLGDLTELAASIRELGVVQPILVSVAGFERYRVLAGERRFSAAKLAGLAKVPAIVRSVEEHARLQLQIIENLHRKDLTPFEEARAYRALADQFRLTQEDIARRLGKSQESVSEALRLLDLSLAIQEGYEDANREAGGRITRSLLLEIARRPEGEQKALWEQARRGELTVKKARATRKAEVNGQSVVKQFGTPRGSAEMRFRYPIHLDGATVTVEFDRGKASTEDIVEALELALAGERQRLAIQR